MKSEFGLPARCGMSFGTAVSLAICCTLGGTAEGNRFTSAAPAPGAACALVTVAAAPATAAPARKFRRFTSGLASGREFFRAISKPLFQTFVNWDQFGERGFPEDPRAGVNIRSFRAALEARWCRTFPPVTF